MPDATPTLPEMATSLDATAAAFLWLSGEAAGATPPEPEKAADLSDRAQSLQDDAAFLRAVAALAPAA